MRLVRGHVLAYFLPKMVQTHFMAPLRDLCCLKVSLDCTVSHCSSTRSVVYICQWGTRGALVVQSYPTSVLAECMFHWHKLLQMYCQACCKTIDVSSTGWKDLHHPVGASALSNQVSQIR